MILNTRSFDFTQGLERWRRSPAGLAWRERVALDVRSLATFRIGLALVILADLATRLADLRAHYTDAGVLPRWASLQWLGLPARLSLHNLNGSESFQAFLFAVAAAFALLLLVGWRTRLATVCGFVLLGSLHARNPMIAHGGDALLRVCLLWAMFLPLGAVASVDRALSATAVPAQFVSVAAFAARLQLCLVYWVGGLHKSARAWHLDGTAIWTALSLDYLATPWGRYLRSFPALLRFLTRASWLFELLGPFGAWSRRGWVRGATVAAFVAFHLLGLAPALRLGNFPWICAVAWSLFLPAGFWERWPRRWTFPERWRLRALAAARRLGQGEDPLVGVLGALPRALAAATIVTVVGFNLHSLTGAAYSSERPAGAVRRLGEFSGLAQEWRMFSPGPPVDDGWYVMLGALRDGREVDLWTGLPPDPRKPASVSGSQRNARWIKYLERLRLPEYVHHRRLFGDHLCREWNRDHGGGEALERLSLFVFLEVTMPPDRELEPQSLLIWSQSCDGERMARRSTDAAEG